MKTIYLHIGQTKTATTTLQAFFFENRNWLHDNGIYYPECPEAHPIKTQHRFLVESIAGLNLPFPDRIGAWDYLEKKIDASDRDKILISEEVFWHLFEKRPAGRKSAIQWIRQRLGNLDVKIICYLRRQDKWIESWYNQIVKTDVNALSRLEYMDFIQTYRDYGLLNYSEALQPWSDVFGEENLFVRPFEKSRFLNGDIIADFMSILGCEVSDSLTRPKDQQVSLCNSACELSLLFNRTPQAAEFKKRFMRVIKQYDADVIDNRRFTSKELSESLLREFEDSNRQLASKYAKGGDDFFDFALAGYEHGEYPGLSVQELANFMIYLFQEQQTQIRGLRKRLQDIE
ncbi:MAG: hypothetical protein HXY27_01295 [Hydrogenophilaceae bacterium]|nr:hypothetical protein [Hydrogenophilaceae bacterium]